MQDAQDFRQPVCESRESDRIVKYLTGDKFSQDMQARLDNGDIWGVYYNEDDQLVAEENGGRIFTGILA